MTDRWGYVVALPLCDYYNEEIWWRVFPPSEDNEEMDDLNQATPEGFDIEEFRQWIEDRLASAIWDVPVFDLDRDIKPGWAKSMPTWGEFMSQMTMDALVDPEDDPT